MNDIKLVVAKNISKLRTENGMTQLELAERLNYSDKAVSKWEHADSMPDISVLVEISQLFNVSLDYIVNPEHQKSEKKLPGNVGRTKHNRLIITGISIMLVWFIVVCVFVSLLILNIKHGWILFLYAVVISSIVWLVFNSIWFDSRRNYLIVTLLMWSLLTCIHITFLTIGINIWPVYILGIPGQLIILLCSFLRARPKKQINNKAEETC